MFCPKCGSQNADETKFCRGCGADLSNVLAVVDGKTHPTPALSEKYIELYSRGMRGLMLGIGFLIISAVIYSIPPRDGIFWLFPLAFAFLFLSVAFSRFIHAKGIKALSKLNEVPATAANPVLPTGQTEYIKPSRSIYETDDLAGLPSSVTEHTTTHLQMDPDGETMTLPKK
jgi:predicted nucleic-acid-binding Zn-ribbon protein